MLGFGSVPPNRQFDLVQVDDTKDEVSEVYADPGVSTQASAPVVAVRKGMLGRSEPNVASGTHCQTDVI